MRILVLLVVAILSANSALAERDVYDRYLDAVGMRELHDGLIFAGFKAAIPRLEAQGLLPAEPKEKAAILSKVRGIFSEEVGFETMRSVYRSKIEELFTKSELEAVIADLEKPAVAAILRRQADAVAEVMVAATAKISPERMTIAQRRIQDVLQKRN